MINAAKRVLTHHVPMIVGPTPDFGVEFMDQIGGRHAQQQSIEHRMLTIMFWASAATDIFPRSGGDLKVTLAEQITDEKRLSVCRDFYAQLKKKIDEDSRKDLMSKPISPFIVRHSTADRHVIACCSAAS